MPHPLPQATVQNVTTATPTRSCEQTLSHAGLTARWWDVSPDRIDESPRRKGYQSALTELQDAKQDRVGYLRVSWLDADLLAERLTDPLAYYIEHRGWCLAPPENVARRWEQVQLHSGVWRPATNVPAEQMAAELDELAARGAAALAYQLTHASVPFVAYAHLDDAYRRRGLGQALYEWTARRLGEQGRVLRASGCQSDDAAAIWQRMTARPDLPVTTIELPPATIGKPPTRHLCLDYRNAGNPRR